MKGIILAAGMGTRLRPATNVVSKQLLCVYNKPMIYYSLSTLMLANIRDIFLISTPRDIDIYKRILGDGSHVGLNISYGIQNKPNGIAEAFLIAEEFVGDDNVCLLLGDNIFYGRGLPELLDEGASLVEDLKSNVAVIYGHHVEDPQRYGVVEWKGDYEVISLEEKPKNPKSNWASVGLYMYDNSVIEKAKRIKPSTRGELEITDINNLYLTKGQLKLKMMGRGYTWFDAGTHDSLLECANFIQTIEKRQGLKVACIEEIAYYMGFINKEELIKLAQKIGNNEYAAYLRQITGEKE